MTPTHCEIQNSFAQRLMEISFSKPLNIETGEPLHELREAWTDNLRHWQTPYSCLVDCRNIVSIAPAEAKAFRRLISHMRVLFMRRIVGWIDEDTVLTTEVRARLPFDVIVGYANALDRLGIRPPSFCSSPRADLRTRILIENNFEQRLIEISFLGDVVFRNKCDVDILQAKLENNLYLWHTGFGLLINCSRCHVHEEAREPLHKLEHFLRTFFCKQVVGFGTAREKAFPFMVKHSRDDAIAQFHLDGEREPVCVLQVASSPASAILV